MDLFDELRTTVLQQNNETDLPSWLLENLLEVAGNPDRYGDKTTLIELLIAQIRDYDPYAGIGCFDTSVGAETIQATIRKITLQ